MLQSKPPREVRNQLAKPLMAGLIVGALMPVHRLPNFCDDHGDRHHLQRKFACQCARKALGQRSNQVSVRDFVAQREGV